MYSCFLERIGRFFFMVGLSTNAERACDCGHSGIADALGDLESDEGNGANGPGEGIAGQTKRYWPNLLHTISCVILSYLAQTVSKTVW